VTQLDTIEHITDFDSAADHVRTRQKWEELSIPMLKGMGAMSDEDLTSSTLKSAFEKHADVTAYDGDEGLDESGMFLKVIKESAIKNSSRAQHASKRGKEIGYKPFTPPSIAPLQRSSHRWKHDGPWLPGMSADDFMDFISRELGHRKKEFRKVLEEYAKNQIYVARRQAASLQSEPLPLDDKEAEAYQAAREKQWSTISSAEVEASIRELRRETAIDPIRSKLVSKLIIPFLRLPPIKLKSISYSATRPGTATGNDHKFTDDTTPSSTHPSAGLGYLRTSAQLSNHPILGPQALSTPVEARVIQPRRTANSTERQARLGVAGFVANDDHSAAQMGSSRIHSKGRSVEYIDAETPGGMKMWVQPQFGSVTPTGRVHLKLKRGVGEDVAVARGQFDDVAPARENNETVEESLLSLMPKGGKVLAEGSSKADEVLNFLEGMTKGKGSEAPKDGAVDALSGKTTTR
jgi:hypothetical protein